MRQSPPTAHRQLSSEYKYSHDRLNHFQMTHGHSQRPATHGGTVWQLYEWQQRQQYRYGSPTAPVYNPAPDYSTAVSSTRVNSDVARSISVPPTLADIPPPGLLDPDCCLHADPTLLQNGLQSNLWRTGPPWRCHHQTLLTVYAPIRSVSDKNNHPVYP